ncbi:F-box/kelch-repeat protein At1g57790 [Eucalyptus grandis]|uniref:F-box/kelch-repeat protein At1g57790 n=1 Tax=Eucalyptus grandis TaxID=71139 RepID=UPI00192EEC49|nr:F-box/kelch-repeat protein At1g57790 [Eucalyptus grandis]
MSNLTKFTSDWRNLPPDLIRCVAERLDAKEFVILRSVCPSWQSAVEGEYNAKTRVPWLISFSESEYLFWSMSRVEVHRARLPSRVGHLCYQGWMTIAQEAEGPGLKLFNPISRIIIELPGPEMLRRVHKVALSSSPSVSDNSVVMVHVQPDTFAFYHPRKRAWTTRTYLPQSQIMDLIHYKGRFVALDEKCRVITFDPKNKYKPQENRVVLEKFEGWPTFYLVECSGSLLFVVRQKHSSFDPVSSTRFQVCKVDLDGGTWTKAERLGSASIFLSYECSFSVELKAKSRLPGIRANHIYFTDFFGLWDHKILSYSMEDGTIKTHPELMPMLAGTTPRWIQPSLCTNSLGRVNIGMHLINN